MLHHKKTQLHYHQLQLSAVKITHDQYLYQKMITHEHQRNNNTRTSTPSSENDNTRTSILSEDDNTQTSTSLWEDDNTRTSTFSLEDDDYEYNDMDFQYNYEDDNRGFQYNFNYEEDDDMDFDNYENEHRQIVDEALTIDKMTSCNNDSELAPYFENKTAASLFCWLQKHNVSTSAYEDLADILHNTNFNPIHVVKNVRRFRTWRERLPLLPISARSISISSKKTPSTSKDSKIAYQLSVSDIIYYVLNNPSMIKHMYFGPGIDSETKSEYWHGTLWGESPLFGEDKITISGGNDIIYFIVYSIFMILWHKYIFICFNIVTYKSGEFIYYHDNGRQLGRLRAILKNADEQYRLRIQKIVDYDNLPRIFRGTTRWERSVAGEVWLQGEPFKIITVSEVLGHIPETTLKITEIVYKYLNRWHIRDSVLSYQHPSDYITIRSPPSSMPTYKLFIDLYYDDFGTYRNVYHSLGGVYLQFGNMPAHQRKLLKNHFVLGFVPFGCNFDEFILPFVYEMKKFEQGKVMKVKGQDAWVIAGLGVVTSDLPQGNDMTGVKRHNANKGCRTCLVSHELLTKFDQDIPNISRYHHITNEQFKEILQENVSSAKEQLCTKYGLRLRPSILDKLYRDRHLQSPQDAYHATAGKIGRLLRLTCELFSREGENDFIKSWKDFEKPKKWSRLPNPISHRDSFMMSDYLRLAMIMPYILQRFLKVSLL